MARESQGPPAAPGDPDWLTLGQAARYLGVAQSTIRKWSDDGRVRAFYTPGGHRRYRRGDLETFLESSGPAGGGGAGPVVLIVDDDEGLRGSAEAGLEVLEEATPDLVLLDVMMPQVDGWEMLRLVQERHGVGTIPVVMFSGKVDTAADEAASRGAQGFIGKPFDPQELVDQTKQLLPG
jgi:excisionase family DNA binding protein